MSGQDRLSGTGIGQVELFDPGHALFLARYSQRAIKERPELAVEILRDLLGADLPPGLPAHLGPPVFNTRASKELIADTVIIAGSIWEPTHGIVVEAQQERSQAKRQKLPRYAAALWLEFDCPVDVLVICPDDATAAWYAEPYPD